MSLLNRFLVLISMSFLVVDATASEPVLTMGYRTTEKQPFIAEAPDNRGLFEDMYLEAARRIGVSLQIVRLPKVRVIKGLMDGSVDFYPQFTFSDNRQGYCQFVANGLKVNYYAISRPEVKRLEQVEDFDGLVLLHVLGNPDYLGMLGFGAASVTRVDVAEMDLQKAIHMIEKGRADAYLYEAEPLEYALAQSGSTRLRLHRQLHKDEEWASLGFSKKSRWAKLEPNPEYDPSRPINVGNQPQRFEAGSVPARLALALSEMRHDGTLDAFYQKYLNTATDKLHTKDH
ncbi:ABC transporter substrate-binding protein [Shewanella amazonensis]|uniref:Solute-binding protein family 3/N-terminal domain-containing protein n=1 Tax=Shewanella amazonensis (strain ATCC BAA-1098 / SB2B) TaxID=326297 RepID=A1SAT5_SHEAM|nr:transporter substrate-binding domain-containing protein [Shewanella amazonensis]ABM01492.1 conserved hypothetical protein [Shewanella amazonensis SB2B]